jgi:hypothetical protein
MHILKSIVGAAVLSAFLSAAGSGVAVAASKCSGTCGEHRYHHKGKCLDARNRPPAMSWSDQMLAQKWAA